MTPVDRDEEELTRKERRERESWRYVFRSAPDDGG